MSFAEPDASVAPEQELRDLLGLEGADAHELLADDSKLDEWRHNCEFDFDVAALLLCEVPPERPVAPLEMTEFDFAAALDGISLEPDPENPHQLLADKQAAVFSPLRPIVELCAGKPYLQWLTADVHLPEPVQRWLLSPHAMMA